MEVPDGESLRALHLICLIESGVAVKDINKKETGVCIICILHKGLHCSKPGQFPPLKNSIP